MADNPDSGGAMSDDDLVAEARAEAIKDGDPETCLVWDLANAIDRLQADLAAAKADAERLATESASHAGHQCSIGYALAAHRALIGGDQ